MTVIDLTTRQSPNSPTFDVRSPTGAAPSTVQVVVLGLCGPRQTGKSTLARAVADAASGLYHDGCVLPFAEPLRQRVRSLLPRNGKIYREKDAVLADLGNRSFREAMEREGDYVRATFGRTHLVRLWRYQVENEIERRAERVAELAAEEGRAPAEAPMRLVIVADDVRTPDEAEAIRDLSGYVMELRRRGVDYGDRHDTDRRLPEACINLVWDLPSADLDEHDELLAREAGRVLHTLLRLRGLA